MLVRGNKLQYNGRGNSLRNQLGKTSTKPSRGALQLCWDFHKDHPDTSRVPAIQIPRRLYSKVTKMRP